MSILITGGMGYIGINLAVELLEKNKKVIILSRSIYTEIIIELKRKFNNQFKFYKVDLLNQEMLSRVFYENIDITTVIHCASSKMFSKKENLANYYQNNINTTLNLLDIMKKCQVKHLIFNSSASIYERNIDNEKQKEDIELKIPKNPYAKSKYILEEILKDFVEKESDFKIDILRIFNPIGIHPFFSKELGYEILKKTNSLITNIALVASERKEKISFYVGEDKNLNKVGIRDYISIKDLLSIYDTLLEEKRLKEKNINIYNAGTRNSM